MSEELIRLGYQPRAQFVPFHRRRQRWACLVVHRRGGKTVACLMDLIHAGLKTKKPDARFAYLAPTYAQAKDTSWSYLKRFTAQIPGIEQRESDLSVVFPNGARVRLYGAESYERLRGTFADGVVLDEYGDFDPRAWPEVLRPSLADRNGWAVFIGTPKGRNDFYAIHKEAETNPEWFSMVLRASQSGLLPQSELDDMRRTLTADQYDQEMEVSFDAAIRGSIYRAEMQAMEADGRICGVPYDPSVPVWTGWDLGIRDPTVIVCAQIVGREIHVIDYYEACDEDLTHYVKWLDSKPYRYATHLLPHDAAARELGSGKTRQETLIGNGLKTRVVPQQAKADSINAVKMLLPRCWLDRVKTERLRECATYYHADFNDRMGVFKSEPVHDWSSHAVDALATLAMGLREARPDAGADLIAAQRARMASPWTNYEGSGNWMSR